jgi:hypothetical protein
MEFLHFCLLVRPRIRELSATVTLHRIGEPAARERVGLGVLGSLSETYYLEMDLDPEMRKRGEMKFGRNLVVGATWDGEEREV